MPRRLGRAAQERPRTGPSSWTTTQRKALLAKKPDLEWSAKLPATDDFQERTEELPAPQGPEAGLLLPARQPRPELRRAEQPGRASPTSGSATWRWSCAPARATARSKASCWTPTRGEPLAEAEVAGLDPRPDRSNVLPPARAAKTDAQRPVLAPRPQPTASYLLHGQPQGPAAGHGQRLLQLPAATSSREPHEPTSSSPTARSTGRARRSSTRASASHVDQEADNYKTLAGRTLTVVFADANGKEIARQQHQTNDYGSFSGSFTAPRDRLMGRMTIRVEGEPRRRDQRQRRGVQAAEVPGDARRAQDGRQAERQGQPDGQGHGLHRRGDRRGQGPLARGPRRSAIPIWWYWCFWWRTPQHGQPGDRPRHGRPPAADGTFHDRVHRPSRTCRCRRRTSRRSSSRSTPT